MTKIKKPILIDVKSVGDELADEIQVLADAMRQLESTRLSRRALKLLLRDATNLNLGDIDRLLDALPNIARWYLK